MPTSRTAVSGKQKRMSRTGLQRDTRDRPSLASWPVGDLRPTVANRQKRPQPKLEKNDVSETISITYLELQRSRNNIYVDHSHMPYPRCTRCSQMHAGVLALDFALPSSKIRCPA